MIAAMDDFFRFYLDGHKSQVTTWLSGCGEAVRKGCAEKLQQILHLRHRSKKDSQDDALSLRSNNSNKKSYNKATI
jgi:hypothetical protein